MSSGAIVTLLYKALKVSLTDNSLATFAWLVPYRNLYDYRASSLELVKKRRTTRFERDEVAAEWTRRESSSGNESLGDRASLYASNSSA